MRVIDISSLDDIPAYRAILDALHIAAPKLTIAPAGTARRIPPAPPGGRLHLFNCLLADHPHMALSVWERIATRADR